MIISRAPFRVSFCGGGSDIPSFYEKIIIKLCKMGLGSEIRPFTEPDYQQLIDKIEPDENSEEK